MEAMSDDVADVALICTPWELHAPMAVAAMRGGMHAASEVPIAYTPEACVELVQVAEETQRHCIMLENCCYNREELWLLNMIQDGVFGTVTHAECAYLHDLRALMLDPTYYEDQWRLKHHLARNGNLYTTHGLGPVCMYFDILRGDTLTHLTSMSSKEAALSEALRNSEDKELRKMAKDVVCGDVNTTLIGTAKGRSIMLQFDVHSGRPYNRLDKVVGSRPPTTATLRGCTSTTGRTGAVTDGWKMGRKPSTRTATNTRCGTDFRSWRRSTHKGTAAWIS